MDNQQIINKLQIVKKFQPDANWLKVDRQRLLSQIMNQKAEPQTKRAEVFYFWRLITQASRNFVFEPMGTFVLLVVLVLGGGVLKVKADTSLPGDFLYAFKQGGQELRIKLARQQEERVSLQLESAGRHLDELAQIADQVNFSSQEKEQRLGEALNLFQTDLVRLDNNLQLADKDTDSLKAIHMAKKVDERANLYQVVLDQTQRKLASAQIKSEVGKAINNINKTDTKALSVLANKHKEAEANISSQEVAVRIEEKIKEASDHLAQLSETIGVASGNGNVSEAKTNSELAQKALQEARENLANSDFIIALEKIQTYQEILDKTESNVAEINSSPTSTETNVNTGLIREEPINVLATSSDTTSDQAKTGSDLPAQTPQTIK